MEQILTPRTKSGGVHFTPHAAWGMVRSSRTCYRWGPKVTALTYDPSLTACHFAALGGQANILQILMRHGADPDYCLVWDYYVALRADQKSLDQARVSGYMLHA